MRQEREKSASREKEKREAKRAWVRTNDRRTRVGEVVEVSEERRLGQERGGRLEGCLEQGRRSGGDSGSVERLVVSFVSLLNAHEIKDRTISSWRRDVRRERGRTDHVISDERQMSEVDLNTVDAKDARDLVDDARPGGLDSVGVKDGGDVVRLDVVHVDEIARVLPHRLEVASFRQESSLERR
jgi:hypothetical protein